MTQQRIAFTLNTPISEPQLASACRMVVNMIDADYTSCIAEDGEGRKFLLRKTPAGGVTVVEDEAYAHQELRLWAKQEEGHEVQDDHRPA